MSNVPKESVSIPSITQLVIGLWVQRMSRNPVDRGRYLVCRADGEMQFLNFGTSRGWDNGRERIDAKVNPKRRVIAWCDPIRAPQEWNT